MKSFKDKALALGLSTMLLCSSSLSCVTAATLKGDINNDGKLTKDDALLIVEKVVNKEITEEDIRIADINNDGNLTTKDAQQLMQQIDPNFLLGDYNEDGRITKIDAFDLTRAVVNNKVEVIKNLEVILRCDVDNDGRVRMLDGFGILKYNEPGNINKDFDINRDDAYMIVDKLKTNTVTEEDIKNGDYNKDGELTIKDARDLMVLTSEGEFLVGDYDKDEMLTQTDIDELRKYITSNGGSVIDTETIIYCDKNNDFKVDLTDVELMQEDMPKLGDLDRNGYISANDAAIVLDIYKNNNATKQDMHVGDMDGNNVIDAQDAAMILDMYKNGK